MSPSKEQEFRLAILDLIQKMSELGWSMQSMEIKEDLYSMHFKGTLKLFHDKEPSEKLSHHVKMGHKLGLAYVQNLIRRAESPRS
jgi:hypothetical protein|tara:strand:+ start:1619 stop:1873 length:255 start_codon:yes stop_codon:yes gene_type:complete